MSQRGFLIIADISGYTSFLTGSELDHAQGVLEDLFAVILERLQSPLHLSNIQGDAFFAFSDDSAAWSSGQILDTIEALYFSFRRRLTDIVDNTSCPCRACANAGKLDLKFVIHHGEYAKQEIAGRQELTGSDVILLHRLLKTDVVARTGIASYGLFTSAAVAALDLAELREETQSYGTDLDELGHVDGTVIDFGARWDTHHAASEITVGANELWMPEVSVVLPFNIETVWAVYWKPELRARWNAHLTSSRRAEGDPNRIRTDSVDHCAHGRAKVIFRYVDVRPLRHVTRDLAIPMNGWGRSSVLFSSAGEGTRITIRCARPEGPNPIATWMLGLIGALFYRNKLYAQIQDEMNMLEEFIAADSRAAAPAAAAPALISKDEINARARSLAAGEA